MTEDGILRGVIESARAEEGLSLKALTVLANQNDPYRLDTPANHTVGQWFAEQLERLDLLHRRLHLRGIHYALLGSTSLTNGSPYTNTESNWNWLQEKASKAARWLGYVRFDSIIDARNDAPIEWHLDGNSELILADLHSGILITSPEVRVVQPIPYLYGFDAPPQPYRLVFFGEKTSLEPILRPVAERYGDHLFLPTGEISDTQLHTMAKAAAEDGRPMIVFTVSDFDPSGWQMPISIGRKLQGFKDLLFSDLDFEVRPVALTRDQAIDFDLPSSPLKETELRADKWREAMGREQTEIDALATLQPEVLTQIIEDAVGPFYDDTLYQRVRQARIEWMRAAQAEIDQQFDESSLDGFREEADQIIKNTTADLGDLKRRVEKSTAGLKLTTTAPELPHPEIGEGLHGLPLISSKWSWTKQTRALIDHKSYRKGAAK